jgi:HKD family nuclease
LKLASGAPLEGVDEFPLWDGLHQAITGAGSIDIASAYFNGLTFSLIGTWLSDAAPDAKVRLLLGANTPIRPMAAVAAQSLLGAFGDTVEIRLVRVIGGVFHVKAVVVRDEDDDPVFVSIGSSNLTDGGLRSNVEMNLVLSGGDPDLSAVAGRVRDQFEWLWHRASVKGYEWWEALVDQPELPAAASHREPLPDYLREVAAVSTGSVQRDEEPPVIHPESEDSEVENVLLLQLSSSEVARDPWVEGASGTASPNLPRSEEAVARLFSSIFPGAEPPVEEGEHRNYHIWVNAIGVQGRRGEFRSWRVNLWSRWRDGAIRETRFSWPKEMRAFLSEDLGRSPRRGDIMVLRWSQIDDSLVGGLDVRLLPASHRGAQELLDGGAQRSDPELRYVLTDTVPSSPAENDGVL